MVDEVVALMVGDGSEPVDKRDVIVVQQYGLFQRISELHVGYMALHYPLLFPYGEDRWLQIFRSMVFFCRMSLWIWMKTMRKNLSIIESIIM
jgi:hypothetical protein